MTYVSAGHIILTPTQPVGSGRPQRELNTAPPHQKSRALPTELPRPLITTQHTDGSPTTPPGFALLVRHKVRAHTHAFRLSISGPDFGQVLHVLISAIISHWSQRAR